MLKLRMNVYITGGNKNLRELAHSLIDYCASKLFSNNLRKKITIDLDFTKTLYKEDGILGEVDFDDSNHRPKEFTMTVDATGSKRRIMETIAHEMVHIKQYAKGELVDLSRCGSTKWLESVVDSKTNYWDLPWEVEAHGKELGLFIRWAEANDLGKHGWTQESLK